MKTLDEVIQALDNSCLRCGECPYCEDSYCRNELEHDALYYLKEYREREKYFDYEELQELRDWWAEEHVVNKPLSWDELKKMEGKPVWIEYKRDGKGEWTIIRIVEEDNMIDDVGAYPREQYGVDWQAYRKEK